MFKLIWIPKPLNDVQWLAKMKERITLERECMRSLRGKRFVETYRPGPGDYIIELVPAT